MGFNDPGNLIPQLIALGMNPGTAKWLVKIRPGIVLAQIGYHSHHKDKSAAALRQRIEKNAPPPASWANREIIALEDKRREEARKIVAEFRRGERPGLEPLFAQIAAELPEPLQRLGDERPAKIATIDARAIERIAETL